MAGSMTLHYVPRNTALHRWECRCKLVGVLLISVSLLRMNIPALALFSVLLITAFTIAKLPWRALLRDFRHWIWFLLVIFVAQSVFQNGSPDWPGFSSLASIGSVQAAAVICWKLALILCYGILFTAITRPREMQDALAWFLSFLPFIPARRIATMISLTIRFFPLMLDQSQEIKMAMKSRSGNQSLNSFRRARYFIVSLFRQSFIRCQEIACALASRGYREDLPSRLRKPPPLHLAVLFILASVTLLSLWEIPN